MHIRFQIVHCVSLMPKYQAPTFLSTDTSSHLTVTCILNITHLCTLLVKCFLFLEKESHYEESFRGFISSLYNSEK